MSTRNEYIHLANVILRAQIRKKHCAFNKGFGKSHHEILQVAKDGWELLCLWRSSSTCICVSRRLEGARPWRASRWGRVFGSRERGRAQRRRGGGRQGREAGWRGAPGVDAGGAACWGRPAGAGGGVSGAGGAGGRCHVGNQIRIFHNTNYCLPGTRRVSYKCKFWEKKKRPGGFVHTNINTLVLKSNGSHHRFY